VTDATTRPPAPATSQNGADSEAEAADQAAWPGILKAVRTPLAFFALALLVIEAPFPVLFGVSGRSNFALMVIASLMSGLIFLVILIVAFLTWRHPKQLVQQIERIVERRADEVIQPKVEEAITAKVDEIVEPKVDEAVNVKVDAVVQPAAEDALSAKVDELVAALDRQPVSRDA
jgi:hypothetical protein